MRMRDVAKAIGVSTMTVSRALREDASIAPATRRAVLDAVQRMGYVPDLTAGSLSSRRSGFVAVLVPSLNNSHFSETVLEMAKLLDRLGLQLLIGDTDYRQDREESLVRDFLARKPEAIILTPDGHTAQTLKLLKRATPPVIEMWEAPVNPIQHVVGFSNRTAMHGLVMALAAKGYRRITFVGETDDEGTRGAARRQGYQDAVAAAGLAPPRVCAIGRPPATMSAGNTALEIVLERFPDTELVVCVSDPLAFGLICACHRRGMRVPQDLAVAGFGDFEISRVAMPTLTTVAVDPLHVAAELLALITMIRDAGKTGMLDAQIRTVPFTAVLRESTPGLNGRPNQP